MSEHERDAFPWPKGKRAAVSVTFDDARPSQLDVGLPILDAHNIKGTFYVSFHHFDKRVNEWQGALARGHEIGNHTVSHPCSGNYQFAFNNALEDYTLGRIEREMLDANTHIHEALGVAPTTFAYPCGQTFVGRGEQLQSYVPVVARHFLLGRGFGDATPNNPALCDPAQIHSVALDGISADQAIAQLQRTVDETGWLVFTGHEVSDGGHQTILAQTLDAICRYCRDPANGVWIDRLDTIGRYIIDARKK